MMKTIKNITLLFIAGTLTMFGASCDGVLMSDSPEGEANVTLSTQITGNQIAVKAKMADGLVIDSAKIHVRSVKLHSAMDEDSLDFKSGSFMLKLDPENPMQEVALSSVPFGVYNKLSFRIDEVEDEDMVSDPDFYKNGDDDDGYSIVLKGAYNGDAFTVRIDDSFKQKVRLDPDLVIDETSPATLNVTLEVDLNSWFEDEDGKFIDPFSEDADEEIEEAIKRSFKAFKDNDKDGEDDDHKGDDGDDDGDDNGDDGDDEKEIEKDFKNTGVDPDASGEVEYEKEKGRTEFKVEVEDLDTGSYDLIVGGNLITSFDVKECEDGTEGEVEFRDPVEEGKLELNFDPLGKTIEVARDSTVYLTVDF